MGSAVFIKKIGMVLFQLEWKVKSVSLLCSINTRTPVCMATGQVLEEK